MSLSFEESLKKNNENSVEEDLEGLLAEDDVWVLIDVTGKVLGNK